MTYIFNFLNKYKIKKIRLISYTWVIIAIIFSPLTLAHAYLDPGTGSYVIQVVIGVVFGAAYAVKSFGANFVAKIKSWKDNSKNIRK